MIDKTDLENSATSETDKEETIKNDADELDPKVWKTVSVVLLGPFMTQLDSTVVNVSLPTIARDLHSTIASAQWIVSGYLLALALMLPINGWAISRVGAKKLYLACFSAFTLTSVLCGFSRSMDQLVCARIVQGIAGGLLAPMAQLMIARVAGKQMARVIGYAAVPILLGPLLGPVLAGVILGSASWPWLFFLNLPIGLLAGVLAVRLLPNDAGNGERKPFDYLGFILIAPALSLLLYGFENFQEVIGIGSIVLGAVLLGGFVFQSRREGERALVDLGVFRIKNFLVASQTQFVSNGITFAGQFLLPLYLMKGCGLSPVQSGWALAPMGIGMMMAYPAMGRVTDRFGCRNVVLSGALINLVATLPFLWMIHVGYSEVTMIICMFFRGIGQGSSGVPAVSVAYASLPSDKLATGATATNIVQRLGGPAITTVMAIAVSMSIPPAIVTGATAFLVPFELLIGIQLLLMVSAVRLPLKVEK